jgi:hypothetical protein
MRWYVVQPKLFESEHELTLYDFLAVRVLTAMYANDRALTWYLEPDEDEERWPAELTDAEFESLIAKACQNHPEDAELIRRSNLKNRPTSLGLSRTGPACPEIVPMYESYVVRESLYRKLKEVAGLKFFNANLVKAVRLNWELGQPVPAAFAACDPEEFVKQGKTDQNLIQKMGRFYEVVLPERPWFRPDTHIECGAVIRLAFETLSGDDATRTVKSSFHEIAFPSDNTPPWVHLVPPNGTKVPAYHFMREDVYEILREPGQWTLEIKEVEPL